MWKWRKERMKSSFEFLVDLRIKAAKLTPAQRECPFLTNRRFRFDFAWPHKKIALECEGAVWVGGRHTRGTGFIKDCQKYNLAVLNGWKVMRYTPDMIDEIIPDLIKIGL